MLKKPLAVVVILSLCLLAIPVTAIATPRIESTDTGANLFTDLYEAWTDFWGSLLGTTADEPTTAPEKNGCGIDPNGNPLCIG